MGSVSSAVDQTAKARVLGIKDIFVDLREGVANLPQQIMVVGQGSTASAGYSTAPKRFFNALDVANDYGFGSPLHLAVRELFPPGGFPNVGTIPVYVFPLDDAGSGVASAGGIAMLGTQLTTEQYTVIVNGIRSEPFAILKDALASTVAASMVTAINAVLEMPVIATDNLGVLEFVSKWAGASANDIYVEVEGVDSGITFTVTQATSGAVNPDVTDALGQADPNLWYTMGINCLEIADEVALDAYEQFGVGRLASIIQRRMTWWTGNTIVDPILASAVADTRKTDQINGQRPNPGSPNLPLMVCAREVAVTAVVANNNPARDYGSILAQGLAPGAVTDQWTYAEQDAALKRGSSTINLVDGVVNIADTVTFYHPTGDLNPAYRYLKDIVKLSNFIFNVSLAFNNPKWDGAPLIPDEQPTENKSAKKPKDAVAEMWKIIDSAGLKAWISDPETAKKATQAAIDDTNPNRLDIATTIQISGNTNIISVDINWGFFFGTAPVVG